MKEGERKRKTKNKGEGEACIRFRQAESGLSGVESDPKGEPKDVLEAVPDACLLTPYSFLIPPFIAL